MSRKDGREVGYRSLWCLCHFFAPAWILAVVFAKWSLKAALSCVFTEYWWPVANLFRLCLFFFLHKIACFSLQMGVWGSSEMFVLVICTAICGLLASQTGFQVGQGVRRSTCRRIRIPAWACPYWCDQRHSAHLKYHTLVLWVVSQFKSITWAILE